MAITRVRLPAGVRPPFDVYVNGVPQELGRDFSIHAGELVFPRALVQEGKVSTGRWLLGAIGIGTYREDHTVDVRYERDGRPMVAHRLPVAIEE